MLHLLSCYLVAAVFFGAGVFNAIGTTATRDSFVRWGYPAWWCRLTGGLEVTTAAFIVFPATHAAGSLLGTVVVAAAALTVLMHRDFSHLLPVGLFVALLAVAGLTS